MFVNIWVKDNADGYVHQIGTNPHDSLVFYKGQCHYYNMQCGCGTLDGEFSFVDPPDLDDYVSVTPKELYLNRELIQLKIRRMWRRRKRIERLKEFIRKGKA